MPSICKVGKTERTPIERLRDANSDTWSPPVWKCEFAKHVRDCSRLESAIHRVLADMAEHIPRREMFKISVEKVRHIFDLVEDYSLTLTIEDRQEYYQGTECKEGQENQGREEPAIKKTVLKNAGCRNQKKCFTDGQSIRHTIANDTWNAVYRKTSNRIEHENVGYKSLTEFVSKHYDHQGIKLQAIKAWQECECFIEEKWVSTYNLPILP